MRPPIFFGVAGATGATVLAFWISTYIWVASEIWLGYKKRLRPAGAKLRDRGSKWVPQVMQSGPYRLIRHPRLLPATRIGSESKRRRLPTASALNNASTCDGRGASFPSSSNRFGLLFWGNE